MAGKAALLAAMLLLLGAGVTAQSGAQSYSRHPCAEEGALRSASSTTAVRLVFVNDGAEELRLIWLDFRGERVPYGTIAPGATFRQDTFSDHAWLAADAAGHCRAIFVATGAPGLVPLSNLEPAPVPEGLPEPLVWLAAAGCALVIAGAVVVARWVSPRTQPGPPALHPPIDSPEKPRMAWRRELARLAAEAGDTGLAAVHADWKAGRLSEDEYDRLLAVMIPDGEAAAT